MAIAKPNSMPVAKRSNSRARAIMLRVISFILTPPDLDDIEDKNETLNEATDSHKVSDGEERHLHRGCNLA
jgi:hypothetical protein